MTKNLLNKALFATIRLKTFYLLSNSLLNQLQHSESPTFNQDFNNPILTKQTKWLMGEEMLQAGGLGGSQKVNYKSPI